MEYEVIKKLSDEEVKKIEQERHQHIDKNNTILVRRNGVAIGFSTICFICGRLTIEYYLFKDFQHIGYGADFVSIVSDYISSNYPNNSSLYLLIHRDNAPSLKVANKCGYKINYIDYEFGDIIHEEMPDYYVYYKANSYYKRNIDKKDTQDSKKLKKIPIYN